MKLKKVLSICKTNGLYYLYDRIDRSGEITQWLGDACALYPLDGLPILDEESFCAVFDISDVLDAMPIKDFNRITNAARSFLIDTGY